MEQPLYRYWSLGQLKLHERAESATRMIIISKRQKMSLQFTFYFSINWENGAVLKSMLRWFETLNPILN